MTPTPASLTTPRVAWFDTNCSNITNAYLANLSSKRGDLPISKFDGAPKSLEEKAKALYKQLSNLIAKEHKQAVKNGKKLMIVMGEDHTDRGSMLAELMLLKIAQDRKIGNLIVEADDDILKLIRDNYKQGKEHPIHIPEIIAYADQEKINVIAGDDPTQTNEQRETLMIQAIHDLNQDGLFLMGSSHMPAVLAQKEQLSKDKHIVILNITSTSAPKQASLSEELQKKDGIIQIEIGDEFESLRKSKILDLAAKATGQADLPNLLIPEKAETIPFKILQRMIKNMGKTTIDGTNTPGLIYQQKMEDLIKNKNADVIAKKLIADDDLKKAYQAKTDAYDKERKNTSSSFDDKEQSALDRSIEEAEKNYNTLFENKAKELGVEDADLLEALKTVYRFDQNDKRYSQKSTGSFKPEQATYKKDTKKEEQITNNTLALKEKIENLYTNFDVLNPSELYKQCNSVALDMRTGDFKVAKTDLEAAIKQFDTAFPNAKGDAQKVKLELIGILTQVEDYINEPTKNKSVEPKEPVQPIKKGRQH